MIDTLYALKTIPLTTIIQDSIVTNASIRGEFEIGVQDSLNFVLSGSPTIMLETSGQTNWTAIIGIATIVMNIIVLIITFCYNRRLQKTETIEIRIRAIQNTAIQKQADMFRLLRELTDVAQDSVEQIDIIKPAEQEKFKVLFSKAQNFHTQNTIYIRDSLGIIVTEVLNIYSDPNFLCTIDTIQEIENKLKKYCDVYNN